MISILEPYFSCILVLIQKTTSIGGNLILHVIDWGIGFDMRLGGSMFVLNFQSIVKDMVYLILYLWKSSPWWWSRSQSSIISLNLTSRKSDDILISSQVMHISFISKSLDEGYVWKIALFILSVNCRVGLNIK